MYRKDQIRVVERRAKGRWVDSGELMEFPPGNRSLRTMQMNQPLPGDKVKPARTTTQLH